MKRTTSVGSELKPGPLDDGLATFTTEVEQYARSIELAERDRICTWLIQRSVNLACGANDTNLIEEARAAEALQQAVEAIQAGLEP